MTRFEIDPTTTEFLAGVDGLPKTLDGRSWVFDTLTPEETAQLPEDIRRLLPLQPGEVLNISVQFFSRGFFSEDPFSKDPGITREIYVSTPDDNHLVIVRADDINPLGARSRQGNAISNIYDPTTTEGQVKIGQLAGVLLGLAQAKFPQP